MADLYIENRWNEAAGAPFTSHNPATNETVWTGHAASLADVDRALLAASKAFLDWSLRPFEERVAIVRRFGTILEEEGAALAKAISIEVGKPYWESLQEIKAMVGKIEISIEAYQLRCPQRSFAVGKSQSVTRHRPHGVAAIFGPFNFPGHLPNGHIIPALLAGNTIVFKPSELTPLCAEVMMSIWDKTALPKGVINMIQGGRDTGKALATHPGINALYFTGSWPTGLWLSQHFANHPEKILALELGGNNPLIVSSIDDPKAAALTTIQSAYITAGQRCTCARRLIVVDSPENKQFINVLAEMIPQIHIAAYTESPEPFMGPVINPQSAQRLISGQEALIAKGGIPLVSMKRLNAGSAFITPGLIDVTAVKEKSDEEFFGPLLQLVKVSDFKSAIEEANRTAYGLVAGLLSNRPEEYDLVLNHVKAGVINWNMPTTGAISGAPFGGLGRSGNHRPSGLYAADYCSYPVASLEVSEIQPTQLKILKE